MKRWRLAVWFAICAAGPEASLAHSGAVVLVSPVEGIQVDGDFGDWPEGVRSYSLDHLWDDPTVSAAPQSPSDLTATVRLGYSQTENALYIALQMRDDDVVLAHLGDRPPPLDIDGGEVYLDVAHGVDREAQLGPFFARGRQLDAMAPARAQDARVGIAHQGGYLRYEWRLDVSQAGATPTPLRPGLVVGIQVAAWDRDRDGGWTWVGLGPARSPWSTSGTIDAILLAPGQATGVVAGTSRWQDGKARGLRPVRISTPDTATSLSVQTDSTGHFQLELPAGTYRLGPSAGAAQQVEVKPSGRVEVEALVAPLPDGRAGRLGAGSRKAVTGRRALAGLGQWKGPWQSLNVGHGLPDPTVTAIFQDRDGYLWFATMGGGVCRYDGHEFLTLTTADGLGSDWIAAIAQTDDGAMWFAGGGLSRLDVAQLTSYSTQDGLLHDNVVTLHVDGAGALWMGTYAGASRLLEGRLTHFTRDHGLPGNEAWAICGDGAGGVWLGTESGLAHFDGQRVEEVAHPVLHRKRVRALQRTRDGSLWIGAFYGDGLFRLRDGEVTRLDGKGIPGLEDTQALFEDDLGHLWVGSHRHGVARWDGRAWTRFGVDVGLAHPDVMAIHQTDDGDLWFGTGWWYENSWAAGNGVSRYVGRSLMTLTTGSGLASNAVIALGEDREGGIWIGTMDQASIFRGDTLAAFPVRDVWDFDLDGQGRMWMISRSQGLLRYERGALVDVGAAHGLPAARGRWLFGDHLGRMWATLFAGGGGVWALSDTDAPRRLSEAEVGTGEDAFSVAVDDEGDIWVGTLSGRATRIHGTEVTHHALGPGNVPAILPDSRGDVWFATFGGGAVRYRKGEGFASFTAADGLGHNRVVDISEDRHGHLWFSTWGGGVTRYDGRAFQTLLTEDGLPSNAAQEVREASNGDIWIATEGGATRFRPSESPPRIEITGVIADRSLPPSEPVRIPATQDYLAFEFVGRSLKTRPNQIVYLYRMAGHDPDWRQTRERRVVYADLPVGEYSFQVQAVDRDLTYSEAPATVPVVVHAAYGRLAAGAVALAGCGAAAAGGLYGLRRRRERDAARATLARERRRTIGAREHDIEGWTLSDFAEGSPAMARVFEQIRALQASDDRALITGEAGTGKELVARAIHAGSRRREGAFVVLRCVTVPRDLQSLELRTAALSTLFGHVRGAFPGADADREGLVQQARGGILFLDEVGLLPPPLQAHLLRVLQEGRVRRAGASQSDSLDLRAMAASSEDLDLQVELGAFNPQLWEYLGTARIEVPPLRERPADVEALAQRIVGDAARREGKSAVTVSAEALAWLRGQEFPGNNRELRRLLEQAVARGAGPLTVQDLRPG